MQKEGLAPQTLGKKSNQKSPENKFKMTFSIITFWWKTAHYKPVIGTEIITEDSIIEIIE